jgi:hypothetical protein
MATLANENKKNIPAIAGMFSRRTMRASSRLSSSSLLSFSLPL